MIPNLGGPPPTRDLLTAPEWDATTRLALEAMIVENAGSLAAIDFDDTILDGDISVALLEDMARSQGRDLVAEYEEDCARNGKRVGYARLVETLIVGRTEKEVRAHTQHVLEDGFRSGTLRLRPALQELIWALQRHRWSVWVVTASPAVVVAPAAALAGVGADRVLGMWCAAGADARFVKPTREPVTFRQGKVEAFSSATGGSSPVFAAGDAITDLEMLCQARYALVVDRGDPDLLAEATKRAWWIQRGL